MISGKRKNPYRMMVIQVWTYVFSLIITFCGFFVVTMRYNESLNKFIMASDSLDNVQYLAEFKTFRTISLVVAALFGVGTIVFHYASMRRMRSEMEIFRRVLDKSITTNMMLNTHSFHNPAIALIAESYNAYVRKKMEEYRHYTGVMLDINDKTFKIEEEKRKNKQIFNAIPFPFYTIYIDKGHSITWMNDSFRELIGIDANGCEESFELPADESDIVIANSNECIERRKPIITHEVRSYAGAGCVNYHAFRTPVMDNQGVCILVVVMLVSEAYIP